MLEKIPVTIKRWEPPADRFVQYEKSDMQWATFFGIGRVRWKNVYLSRVYDEDCVLVGLAFADAAVGRVSVPIPEDTSSSSRMWPDCSPACPYRVLDVRAANMCVSGSDRIFNVWKVDRCNLDILKLAGFIYQIGTIELHEKIRQVEARWQDQVFSLPAR